MQGDIFATDWPRGGLRHSSRDNMLTVVLKFPALERLRCRDGAVSSKNHGVTGTKCHYGHVTVSNYRSFRAKRGGCFFFSSVAVEQSAEKQELQRNYSYHHPLLPDLNKQAECRGRVAKGSDNSIAKLQTLQQD